MITVDGLIIPINLLQHVNNSEIKEEDLGNLF